MDFVVSTESVNKYGYRVLTDGIDTTEFEKNPVMFYNHDRWAMLPIGRWENVRKEDGKLIATAVLDDNDPFAQEVKAKIEAGYLNATSIGFDPVEYSEDETMLLPGQKRPTVTKAKLLEISVVDIPANGDAMKLKMPNNMLVLGGGIEDENVSQLPIIQSKDMKKIAKALGLSEDATEGQVIERIDTLNKDRSAAVELLGSLGEQAGLNKESLVKLADRDFAETLKLVQVNQQEANAEQEEQEEEPTHPFAQLSAVIEELKKNQNPQGQQSEQGESLREMEQKDPAAVRKLILESPDQYKDLYKAQYGVELSAEDFASVKKLVG